MGQPEQAQPWHEQALAASVKDAHLFFHAAMIHLATGRTGEGKQFLKRFAGTHPVARAGMHDGSMKTLEDVVGFYNKGGHRNPWIAAEIQPLNLAASEQADLVAFLEALTGEVAPELSNPPKLP